MTPTNTRTVQGRTLEATSQIASEVTLGPIPLFADRDLDTRTEAEREVDRLDAQLLHRLLTEGETP